MPIAGLVAAAVALILGAVSLRTRGHAFVIITIAFLLLVQVIAVNCVSLTNGSDGLTLPLPTWDRDIQNLPFYYALIVILALQVLMTWWIRRTKFGIGLIAIREDETKAATIGVNLPVEKVVAYVASAVFVGVAGAVYAYYLTFIDPLGMFSILISVQIVLSTLIGGRGTLWGPVLGAFLIEWLNEVANNDCGGGNARLLLFGGLLVLVVLFLPNGILPAVESLLSWRRTRGKAGQVGVTDRHRRQPGVHHRPGAPGRPQRDPGPGDAGGQEPQPEPSAVCVRSTASFAVPEGTITGADRAERLGQDDAVQPDRRHHPRRLG